jgi:GT2 family glycosyltransferase
MIECKGTPNERIVAASKNLLRPWMIPVAAKPDQRSDYISGACLVVKRRTIEDIGLLDEDFFFFFEDADYSLRAKQANWRLSIAPGLHIQHLGSATVCLQTEFQARACCANTAGIPSCLGFRPLPSACSRMPCKRTRPP